MAETYRDELRFMRAVRSAFDENGLAPRDLIDVQSALWVVYNYKDDEMGETNLPSLERAKVETTMDAYDQFRQAGENGTFLGRNFTEPKNFWVRSTRNRSNRVFPSKPIHFGANGQVESSGGWGGPSYSAAALHNSGYIIVDEQDQPVDFPTDKPFLIRDADRIRLCALNYFIAPARERGEAYVSIRAGDLSKELMLNEAWANVCQTLKGKKFQELADVPPPVQEGPDASTTTTFMFDVRKDGKQRTMKTDTSDQSRTATNLILYGPPGTGKTYATAWEAVRLCLGDKTAAPFKGDRDALMAEYRRLVGEGRIEFTTFHQSMSYEEFVEGLRPSTGEDDSEGPPGAESAAGFSLKCHEGIFKRTSERARLDQGDSGGTQRLDRGQGLFKLSLIGSDWRDQLATAVQDDGIAWGFGAGYDWSAPEFGNFQAIKQTWQHAHPDVSSGSADISGTWYFRGAIDIDSYVILTVGNNRIVALGQVAGDYEFRPDVGEREHFRKMTWLWTSEEGADRSAFYPKRFSAWQPMYQLAADKIDWDTLEEIAFGADTPRVSDAGRDHVLIIDEINRANISKVFGELITLLEQDKRLGARNELRVQLTYSKKRFGVPPNLHIVGTMNTADRSIALLDTALRRRFTFQELMPDPTVLSEDVGGINLRTLLYTINERIEYLFDREHQIGHAYFTGCHSRADVEDVMRHKVIPLLAEYFYEDWAKVAAVLGDGPGMAKEHFLESASLQPPKGMPEDDINGDKLRWNVKADFDFSEFEA